MVEISEWLNICVGCGSQKITHGAELPGQCPECRGWRWLCHLQTKMPEKRMLNPTETTKDIGAIICHPINNPLSANPKGDILTPSVKKPKGQKKAGLEHQPMLDDLIKQLASQGLGCKAIESKLLEQGIAISYRTIARRLQDSLL